MLFRSLVGTALGVVLAHAVTGLPYVVLTVSASLSNLDPRLEQAARGLGSHPIAVVVPLVVRTLVRAGEVADAIDARGFPPRPDFRRPS